MVVTQKTVLPTEEDLNVEEVNLSWIVLHAASFYLGKACEPYNNEFVLCRREEKDATKCINEGKAVTACALSFFRKLKKHCHEEFEQYQNCVYRSTNNMSFMPCRNTESILSKCVLDNMNIERPAYGYFSEVKIHETTRPKPEEKLKDYPTIPGPAHKNTMLPPFFDNHHKY